MKIKRIAKIVLIILGAIFLIIGVPIIINECYKANFGYNTVWNGADVLGLGGALRWFSNEYGELYSSIPVMVHKSTIIDRQATAVPNMMIITPECLELLKRNVNEFAIAVSQNENWQNEDNINRLLARYKLRGNDISENYMRQYRNE